LILPRTLFTILPIQHDGTSPNQLDCPISHPNPSQHVPPQHSNHRTTVHLPRPLHSTTDLLAHPPSPEPLPADRPAFSGLILPILNTIIRPTIRYRGRRTHSTIFCRASDARGGVAGSCGSGLCVSGRFGRRAIGNRRNRRRPDRIGEN